MGKKRVNPEPTRRRNRVEPTRPSQLTKSAPTHGSNSRLTTATTAVFILIFVASSALSVLVYRRHNRNNLATTDVNYLDIINENSRVSENVSERHFANSVLAYITPWNSAGYDLAKRFNSKFTHLSPVWYDLKSEGTKLTLEGRHNADTGWLSELRVRGKTQVLPRFVLEALPKDLLGKKQKLRNKAIDLIVTECKDMDYDGVVLEAWSRWTAYGALYDVAMRKMALQFVKQLGDALHKVRSQRNEQQLQLVFVIGPPGVKLEAHDFGPEDLLALGDSVDGFSLMTYDFSSPMNPGPNAPLVWVHSTIEILLRGISKNLASKLLVGINFYGNDYDQGGGAQAITGKDYLSLLDRYKPKIEWSDAFAEHYFLYVDDQNRHHVVFYPTPMSISKRLEEARSWGAGLSIWEIGQGLDFFFDLL